MSIWKGHNMSPPNLRNVLTSDASLKAMKAASRRINHQALNLVFPPQSLLTGQPSHGRDMESELWGAVTFLDQPCCACCGFPFEFTLGSDSLCGRCAARQPAYSRVRSAFQYDDNSRKLVLDFKHGGRTTGLSVFAGHMRRAGRDLLSDASFVVPVPLHPSRLRARRYNQSTLLARAVALPKFDADILMRHRATLTQGSQSTRGRRSNVSGAFRIRQAAKPRLKGARITLIDDVFTTGATLEACARALKRAGSGPVDALTLARVVKPQDIPT